jgi:hypothetical protein
MGLWIDPAARCEPEPDVFIGDKDTGIRLWRHGSR